MLRGDLLPKPGGRGRVVQKPLRLRSGARWGRGRPHCRVCARVGVTISCHQDRDNSDGMATTSAASDLTCSAAPSPVGGAQAAAAVEEEEREVVRVRVKVRLVTGRPAWLGTQWMKGP